MNHPLLYEINTRCWLRALSEQHDKTITLASVPDAEIARWQKLGFTHIWAMGVWTTGPRCRNFDLNNPSLRATLDRVSPGCRPEDILGSPYGIADYQVPDILGGEAGLKSFRKKLKAHGLKLILDFVPNHLGLDHPWAIRKPEMFVQSPVQAPGTFAQQTDFGLRWLAHGKDPNFAAWEDTIQINYRRADTRAAMIEILQSIARRCDGVRCDMAMLELNEVFARTWAHLPEPTPPPTTEFWAEATGAVRKASPDFLFLAEVYWGLEQRMESLGFNYTYDKAVCDCLLNRHYGGLQQDLLARSTEHLFFGAHFLENHDERRVASVLSQAEHRAAALVILGLPGMRFLYEGQLQGWRTQIPVQLGSWPKEPTDAGILAMYEQLLGAIKNSAVGQGDAKLLRPTGWPDNQSCQNVIVVQWQKVASEFDLVVVNPAPHPSQCSLRLEVAELAAHHWELRDLLSAEVYERPGEELARQGLYLDLGPQHAQIFHFKPKTR